MEFVELVVKVTTLNKKLFEQLDAVTDKDFDQVDGLPEIKGRVKDGLFDWVIIVLNGKLAKSRDTDFWWLWRARSWTKICANTWNIDEQNFEYRKYLKSQEQIFI